MWKEVTQREEGASGRRQDRKSLGGNNNINNNSNDEDLDQYCRDWVSKTLNEPLDPLIPFATLFKDGVLLCRVINKIIPNTIKQIHNSPLAFKQMENVENYLKGCTALGLSDTQLFNTIDLYEEKDVDRVKRNIFNLSKAAAGNNNNNNNNNNINSGQGSSSFKPKPIPPARVGKPPAPTPPVRKTSSESKLPPPPVPSRGIRPGVPPRPIALRASPREAMMKKKAKSQVDVSSLQDDIHMKAAFKYNPILEQQAKSWIENVLGLPPNNQPFYETFKDGVLLCRLINKIKPGTIGEGSYKESSIAYKQMENIAAYTKGCLALGISQFDCFNTVDLFEAKNMNLVINNIHVLAKHVEAQELNPSLPKIENSSRARRAYSIFFTEVAGLRQHLQEGGIDDLGGSNEGSKDEEEQELIGWINNKLQQIIISSNENDTNNNNNKNKNKKIEGLKDLRDGTIIIQILEHLTDQSVGIYSIHPKMPWHSMQNATLILRFINEQTLQLFRGCTGHDIFLGNSGPLKVLLKLIREKFDREYNFRGLQEDTKRYKVIEELYNTEKTYVQLLGIVVESLVKVLKDGMILQSEEIEEVFANIEDIHTFHKGLLSMLEDRMTSYHPTNTLIADIMVTLFDSSFVSLYKRYVRDFDATHLVIRYLASKYEAFQNMIEKFEKEQANANGLQLNSFLILPVQRVPRYMLLLQELSKYTSESHPDYHNMKSAVQQTSVILDDINSSKKTSDDQEKLKAIESSISGLENLPVESLVHPKRKYIHEGKLEWEGETEGDAYFFLFSDFLMHCVTTSTEEEEKETKEKDTEKKEDNEGEEKGFQYITIIPISFFQNVEDSKDNPTAFLATFDADEVGTFVAPTEEDKQDWLKHLRTCMNEKITIEFDL